MKWEDVSFVVSSRQRKNILTALENPATPTHIGKAAGISLSNVGKKLSDLQERDLVKCLTPNVKKGRIYSLTENGKKVLEQVKKMENKQL